MVFAQSVSKGGRVSDPRSNVGAVGTVANAQEIVGLTNAAASSASPASTNFAALGSVPIVSWTKQGKQVVLTVTGTAAAGAAVLIPTTGAAVPLPAATVNFAVSEGVGGEVVAATVSTAGAVAWTATAALNTTGTVTYLADE